MSGCSKNDTVDFHGVVFPVTVDNGIIIEDCFLYSGDFPEDGSFAKKNDVLALKVKNTSDSAIQLIRIKAETDEKDMLFEITTLPAGATVTVLEKNAQSVSAKEKINSFTAENRVDFEKPLTINEDIFTLTEHDSIFNIRNISNTDIASDIYVYYKKMDAEGNYFGGITFRTKAQGLESGELKQIPASHFNPQDSEVLFIDFISE